MPSLHAKYISMHKNGGFTLVELLLAVALSAVVAALAYAGINNGMQAATAMATQVSALTEMQRAFSIIEDDLAQIRLRPLSLGVGYHEAALVAPTDAGALLSFTRGGVANPRQLLRSELQRVRYEMHGDGLWRLHWAQLDRADVQQKPQQVLLLTGVSRASFEFLAAGPADSLTSASSLQADAGHWQTVWNSDAPQHALAAPLPIAVRITLDSQQYGQVQRVFELP